MISCRKLSSADDFMQISLKFTNFTKRITAHDFKMNFMKCIAGARRKQRSSRSTKMAQAIHAPLRCTVVCAALIIETNVGIAS